MRQNVKKPWRSLLSIAAVTTALFAMETTSSLMNPEDLVF